MQYVREDNNRPKRLSLVDYPTSRKWQVARATTRRPTSEHLNHKPDQLHIYIYCKRQVYFSRYYMEGVRGVLCVCVWDYREGETHKKTPTKILKTEAVH